MSGIGRAQETCVCVFMQSRCTVKRKCLITSLVASAGISETLPKRISSFNGCKNLRCKETKQMIHYLGVVLFKKLEDAVLKMLCRKSATDQHELHSVQYILCLSGSFLLPFCSSVYAQLCCVLSAPFCLQITRNWSGRRGSAVSWNIQILVRLFLSASQAKYYRDSFVNIYYQE